MIALIAGTGSLPKEACKSLLAAKKDFLVVTLFPEDNLVMLRNSVPKSTLIIHQPFYKAQTILSTLKQKSVTEVLFIGKVDKQNLLKKFKLDWFAIKLLASLATKSDTSIMNKIAEELKKHDIEVLSQDLILNGLFTKPGILTGKLTPEIKENINFGLELAEQMSTYDIGQTVIVKDKMVLAVEAIEGTNACIKRGISIGKNNVIICKSANKNHNTKFDLPTIGPKTLQGIERGEVSAIAWQASHTFIADKENFIEKAKKLNITLVSQ